MYFLIALLHSIMAWVGKDKGSWKQMLWQYQWDGIPGEKIAKCLLKILSVIKVKQENWQF